MEEEHEDFMRLCGMENGDLIVLGGRPAMGKTSFALYLSYLHAQMGHDVIYMTFSESKYRMAERMEKVYPEDAEFLKRISLVDRKHFDGDFATFEDIYNMSIDNESIEAGTLIIIDYAQMIGSSNTFENEHLLMNELMNSLKNMALKKDIIIVVLSQLSRAVEERQGHRPIMKDLRSSGAFEEVADKVVFIMRREYYDPNDKPGLAEVIVSKNRFGATGTVNYAFVKEKSVFYPYEPIEYKY